MLVFCRRYGFVVCAAVIIRPVVYNQTLQKCTCTRTYAFTYIYELS